MRGCRGACCAADGARRPDADRTAQLTLTASQRAERSVRRSRDYAAREAWALAQVRKPQRGNPWLHPEYMRGTREREARRRWNEAAMAAHLAKLRREWRPRP